MLLRAAVVGLLGIATVAAGLLHLAPHASSEVPVSLTATTAGSLASQPTGSATATSSGGGQPADTLQTPSMQITSVALLTSQSNEPRSLASAAVMATDTISRSEVESDLNTLRSQLLATAWVGPSFSGPAASTPANFQAVAMSQRIDQLNGTTFSNVTVHGVGGLTAADIPTNIVAANYLPLSGGAHSLATCR